MPSLWTQDLRPQNTTYLILGNGDVVHRFYIPSLFAAYNCRRLPPSFVILLVSRKSGNVEDTRSALRKKIEEHLTAERRDFNSSAWEEFSRHIHHHVGDATKLEMYPHLIDHLSMLSEQFGTGGNVEVNIAVPTWCYKDVIENLRLSSLADETAEVKGATRSLLAGDRYAHIEKPLGSNLNEIEMTNRLLVGAFPTTNGKPRVYRGDHYLFKPMVMAIPVLRENPFLKEIWGPERISRIEVYAAELIGVNGRTYEGAGRDMVSTHLMQVLGFLAAPMPKTGTATDRWAAIEKFFNSCRLADDEYARCAIRGRYRRGSIGRQEQPGYLEESGTDPTLETFAGVRIKSEFWPNTEFILYSGKRCPERRSGATVFWKPEYSETLGESISNRLDLQFGPEPKASLGMVMKRPGSRLVGTPAEFVMDQSKLGGHSMTAYELLRSHLSLGIHDFFATAGATEAAAKVFEPLFMHWGERPETDWSDYPCDTWPDEFEERLGNCALVDYSKSRE